MIEYMPNPVVGFSIFTTFAGRKDLIDTKGFDRDNCIIIPMSDNYEP